MDEHATIGIGDVGGRRVPVPHHVEVVARGIVGVDNIHVGTAHEGQLGVAKFAPRRRYGAKAERLRGAVCHGVAAVPSRRSPSPCNPSQTWWGRWPCRRRLHWRGQEAQRRSPCTWCRWPRSLSRHRRGSLWWPCRQSARRCFRSASRWPGGAGRSWSTPARGHALSRAPASGSALARLTCRGQAVDHHTPPPYTASARPSAR